MSRVGKQPIEIPSGIDVRLDGRVCTAKGPLGQLQKEMPLGVEIQIENSVITVLPPARPKEKTAFQGLARALINNMIIGVSQGFIKKLDMVGIGYRAFERGKNLEIHVGFSHPVDFKLLEGVEAEVDKDNRITIKGIDKEKVGQVAADIRAIRPPEPYKGKGIQYVGERIRRKAGKAGV
jgi:large subunit ribosomal protein L6